MKFMNNMLFIDHIFTRNRKSVLKTPALERSVNTPTWSLHVGSS